VHFAEHVVLAAVGIDVDGEKHPLGLREGATENAAACKALLEDLIVAPGGPRYLRRTRLDPALPGTQRRLAELMRRELSGLKLVALLARSGTRVIAIRGSMSRSSRESSGRECSSACVRMRGTDPNSLTLAVASRSRAQDLPMLRESRFTGRVRPRRGGGTLLRPDASLTAQPTTLEKAGGLRRQRSSGH
jgi:hypothetical protein